MGALGTCETDPRGRDDGWGFDRAVPRVCLPPAVRARGCLGFRDVLSLELIHHLFSARSGTQAILADRRCLPIMSTLCVIERPQTHNTIPYRLDNCLHGAQGHRLNRGRAWWLSVAFPNRRGRNGQGTDG